MPKKFYKAKFTGGWHNGTDYEGAEWGWQDRKGAIQTLRTCYEDIYGTWEGKGYPPFPPSFILVTGIEGDRP